MGLSRPEEDLLGSCLSLGSPLNVSAPFFVLYLFCVHDYITLLTEDTQNSTSSSLHDAQIMPGPATLALQAMRPDMWRAGGDPRVKRVLPFESEPSSTGSVSELLVLV